MTFKKKQIKKKDKYFHAMKRGLALSTKHLSGGFEETQLTTSPRYFELFQKLFSFFERAFILELLTVVGYRV